MLLIRTDYGEGGMGVGSTQTANHPRIAGVLRGLVDNDTARTTATITSIDATDLAEVLTLANEIKAALNTASGAALEVDKAPN